MTRPPVGSVAEDVYARLEPLAADDESYGWPLLILSEGGGTQVQEAEDLVRDSDAHPGWGTIMDPTVAPDKWVPWLGQFVGVSPNPDLSDDDARTALIAASGQKRGTPTALIAEAQKYLTGTKTVILVERQGDAHTFGLTVFTSEVTDRTKLLAALTLAKPAGLIMNFSTIVGGDYLTFKSVHTDYTDVKAQFATYTDARNDPSLT